MDVHSDLDFICLHVFVKLLINMFCHFVDHNRENRTRVQGYEGAGEYSVLLWYYVGWAEAITIIDNSESCGQFMRWECKAAIIHNPYNPDWLTTFWMNRTEQMANYFGGATPNSGNCACGETNSCFNSSLPCNCDENDEEWRYDEGWVTHKPDLPIHSFYAGDTGMYLLQYIFLHVLFHIFIDFNGKWDSVF